MKMKKETRVILRIWVAIQWLIILSDMFEGVGKTFPSYVWTSSDSIFGSLYLFVIAGIGAITYIAFNK